MGGRSLPDERRRRRVRPGCRRQALDRLVVMLGVYERPSDALDELVRVVFVGEHLGGHVSGEQRFEVMPWYFG